MPKQIHKTKIGGQALIEGIMMRGVRQSAMAVRRPNQEIHLEVWQNKDQAGFLFQVKKVPLLRGAFAMGESVISGYRCMMKSAEIAGFDLPEQEEHEENKEQEKQGRKPQQQESKAQTTAGGESAHPFLEKTIPWIGGVLGVVLSIVLFLFLPTLAVRGIDKLIPLYGLRALVEGLIKISIFVGYLALVGLMPDMRRVFQYHGAEHKTIACFEAQQPLTVENIRKQTRFHPRCGTSFLILVLIVSIFVFSVVSWDSLWMRTLLKLLLLPIVIGISYELIKLAGRYDNPVTRLISFPGLQLQRLTTKEPDDDQIEVAIAALEPVLPADLVEDAW